MTSSKRDPTATGATQRRAIVSVSHDDVPRRDVSLPGTTRRLSLASPHEPQAEQLRDALPPPPGYVYTLDGRLVPLEDIRQDITDPDAQSRFCEVIELTGSFRAACDALGIVSMTRVKGYILKDPDFADAVEASAERHRQALYAHAVRRATVGYQVPIVGGKDKNEIVGYETRVSDMLLLKLLQRHFPEFRDKTPQVSVTVADKQMPDFKSMSRDQRAAFRLLLRDAPTETEEIIDVTDSGPGDQTPDGTPSGETGQN